MVRLFWLASTRGAVCWNARHCQKDDLEIRLHPSRGPDVWICFAVTTTHLLRSLHIRPALPLASTELRVARQWKCRNRKTFNSIALWDIRRMLLVGSEPLRKGCCCRLQFGKWWAEEGPFCRQRLETLAPVFSPYHVRFSGRKMFMSQGYKKWSCVASQSLSGG